jgi:hypothetical protein
MMAPHKAPSVAIVAGLGCQNVEGVQMGVPGRVIGKALLRVACQLGDDRGGQPTLAHIGEGCLVEHEICVARAQEAQEIGPALRPGGGEEGEGIIANGRTDAVLALVPGASIIHGNPLGRCQAGPQYVAGLGDEGLVALGQDAHHLPLGDVQPQHLQ